MRNSLFFKEAAIVANDALRMSEPLTIGIASAIKGLRDRRERMYPDDFVPEIFNRYAAHYEALARVMVAEYLKYQEHAPYNKTEEE
jgi:hypothetical protein